MIARQFLPAIEASAERSGAAWWFVFQDDRLVVRQNGEALEIPYLDTPEELGLTPVRRQYLGRLDGQACFAVEIDRAVPLAEGLARESLRAVYGRLPDDLFALAGRAVQILTWDRTHQFCGQCGTPTVAVPGERARECPACGLRSYPRISPAVIVLVTRGERLLLTRGHQFPEGFYGVLAGFVEAGESLEETVEREIQEEVGLTVTDVRYFGSQPWPFPHQLMIGFTARWAAGEIRVDPQELADAAWFTRDTLPHIPPRMSIARRLIDWFLGAE
ncbi:MAG TPA: NAD(+) diphosphatase [Chloroflexota bacterium]|nr:NAD(+) diphosphatase [Chloroflexota bacterium]